MSNDKKKLPPKVAAFISEAKPVLEDYPAQVKRADDAEARENAAAVSVTKLAEETADALLAAGCIVAEDRAKFASDLVDPARAHNVIRALGKKVVAAERNSVPPVMGGPAADSQRKTAGEEGDSYSVFGSRVRQASGV